MQANGPLAEIRNGRVTIVVFGEDMKHLDESRIAEVGRKLLEIVDGLPHPVLVFDMASTEFFGSSFIELLFRIWKRLTAKPSAKFGIAGLQPYCREVLEVTHLDTLWPLFDTQADAINAFKLD